MITQENEIHLNHDKLDKQGDYSNNLGSSKYLAKLEDRTHFKSNEQSNVNKINQEGIVVESYASIAGPSSKPYSPYSDIPSTKHVLSDCSRAKAGPSRINVGKGYGYEDDQEFAYRSGKLSLIFHGRLHEGCY